MFDSERREILERTEWSPRSPGDGHLAYLEAWEDGDFEEVPIVTGPLEDFEVDEWLRQRGKFSRVDRQSRPRAQIRILLCERRGFRPLQFSMSRKSFLSVEHAIGLPSVSLPILNVNTGTQHAHLKFKKDSSGWPSTSFEALVLTIKQPQLFQLGNLGMAMSHHFETRTTLAFIHGWDIFSDKSAITHKPIVPHIEAIQEMLKSSRSLLSHPLLLPVMILRRHLTKAEIMRRQLSSLTARIEEVIGVTKTARNSGDTVQYQRVEDDVNKMLLSEKLRIETTARISTTVTDVINMKGTLEWDGAYVKFLRRVNDDVKAHHGEAHMPSEAALELCGFIDLLEQDAQSISSYATRMQSRLELQFNVLYNLIAQTGNRLNMHQSRQAAQVATQAGMDSTAMKTMAVVTMVFLPPTFVATIFSMSMFNWQASSSGGDGGGSEPIVVPQFWIYWAVSLPLTIAIVMGWRVWWHFQKAYYETKFLRPKEDEAF